MSEDIFDQLGEDAEPPATLMGLELFYDKDNPIGVPLAGLAIVKTMSGGEIGYRLVSTDDLNTVECLGMLRWAQMIVENGMFDPFIMSDEEEDSESDD